MTSAEALRIATLRLTEKGIDGAPRDARRLLAFALGSSVDRLAIELPEAISDSAAKKFDAAIALRGRHVPLSHITGERMFYGRMFKLDRTVLDPRPETETLIEAALKAPFDRVLDLGTGTGCILVTLLAEQRSAIGTGVDISPAARSHALGNAIANRVSDRAEFRVGDWFDTDPPLDGRFDLIVSNPPYIAAAEMAGLAPEVRDFEPHIALTDNADGLSAYRAIASGVTRFLTTGGRLLLEIGPSQAKEVSRLLQMAGLGEINVLKDLDGRDRVVSATAISR
jgi:release factor glutamine methyltransferase